MDSIPRLSRPRALAYLAVILALLALGGRFLVSAIDDGAGSRGREQAGQPIAVVDDAAALASESSASTRDDEKPSLVVVHVVGAVRSPGLYRLEEGSRVADAIRKAGGAKAVAALALVNLAAPVGDGQQIVVPRAGPSGAPGAEPSAAAPTGTPGPLHLNTATLEQLDALPGVGPVTAQRILDYRDEHGSFRSLDELDAVSGIGPARLEQLRELVAV